MDAIHALLALDAAPGRLRLPYRDSPDAGVLLGSVIGLALNERRELASLDGLTDAPPYQKPAQRPVLYLKPANTHVISGTQIALNPQTEAVSVAGCLGIVLGAPLARASADEAARAILGYTIAADLSVPHDSYYRPAIRQKCQDGFCPIGPWLSPRASVGDPDGLDISVEIDGVLAERINTADLIRSTTVLLADISQFMTLQAGDLILAGASLSPAHARHGAQVAVRIAAIGTLTFSIAADAAQAEPGDRP
jgi:5-oxopent-3-ene-1,2,5-tricarboxylate decarboxylase / 2-hydroxyhepta-2,4-diene-1,7-dioate isomerase